MNVVFGVLVLASLALLALTAPQMVLSVMLDGTSAAVTLALRLVGVYALWMGILQVAEDSGLDRRLARLYDPLLSRMFRGETAHTRTLVGLNLTANLLGLGAAATPLGIAAVESMSDGAESATDNMILFFVLNVTAIQLLPTTVMALRADHGSANPADIMLPGLLCSVLTALVAVGMVYLCRLARKFPLRMRKKQCNL